MREWHMKVVGVGVGVTLPEKKRVQLHYDIEF